MSADSSRKARSSVATQIVTPQPVSDRSIIESVAGFINDVVPQAYSAAATAATGGSGSATISGSGSGTGNNNISEPVLWAHFENCDANDTSLFTEDDNNSSSSSLTSSSSPLFLVLGYATGVQVWFIPGNSQARIVLSWRQGPVRCLRLLPTPSSRHAHRPGYSTDQYSTKRPLVALCQTTTSGTAYCTVDFISLRTGETVKTIHFIHAILDILANDRRVILTFLERIAIFDASTFEDRFTITTCYSSPTSYQNPVALGSRWLAYADRQLRPARRSAGGADPVVYRIASTFFHTVKTVGKGLRGLGETVASSLGGTSSITSGSSQLATGMNQGHHSSGIPSIEGIKPGVVTIVDIMGSSPDSEDTDGSCQSVIAHFVAHNEAIVSMSFDSEGMLLMTADKSGHDFNVFRIHPHPIGSASASVHHLYILRRGDTTAKVQSMTFSSDSRWAAVTTLRGTTHVFPITSYGGPIGLRTHTSPHVVNRLSRFQRSAGLTAEGRNSPIPFQHYGSSHGNTNQINNSSSTMGNSESIGNQSGHSIPWSSGPAYAYPNPRVPPFPTPTIIDPLSRIRHGSLGIATASGGSLPASPSASTGTSINQPTTISHTYNSGANLSGAGTIGSNRIPPVRRAVSAEDAITGIAGLNITGPVRVATCFATPRASQFIQAETSGTASVPESRDAKNRLCDSLYVWSFHANVLYEYELEPKPLSSIPKEKQSDDTPIELDIKYQSKWKIPGSLTSNVTESLPPPLSPGNPLLITSELNSINSSHRSGTNGHSEMEDNNGSETTTEKEDNRWLSQVEIASHYGPHRRLWMGPQFTFKTYSGGGSEAEAIDVIPGSNNSGPCLSRTSPVNIGHQRPVLIESGSASSLEHSPRYGIGANSHHGSHSSLGGVSGLVGGESQLREDLADAMLESPGALPSSSRDIGCANNKSSGSSGGTRSHAVEKVVNPLGTVITLGSTEGLLAEVTNANDAVRWPSDVKKPPPKITVAEEAYFAPSSHTKGPTLKPQRNPLILTKKKLKNELDKETTNDPSNKLNSRFKKEDLEEYFSLESESAAAAISNVSKGSLYKFNANQNESIREERLINNTNSHLNDNDDDDDDDKYSKPDRPAILEGLYHDDLDNDENKKEVLDSYFTLDEEKNCSKEDLDTYFSSEDEGQSRLKLSSSNSEKEFSKDDPDLYFSTEDESGGGGSKSEQSEWFPTSLSDLETETSITSTQISSTQSSSSNGNIKNKSGRRAKKKRR